MAQEEQNPEKKRKEKLAEALAAFPQLNPNPLLEVDFSGQITFCNKAASKVAHELGLPDAAGFLPEDLADIISTARQGQESWFYREVRLGNRVFGEDLHVDQATQVVRLYGLDVTELLAAKEELTRHREHLEELVREAAEVLQEREEHFRAVMESASDAIISADSQGNIIFWNQGAQTLFGYSAEEVLGRPLTLLIPERYRQAHAEALERLRTAGESRLSGQPKELEGLKKDGSEFSLEHSFSTWKTEKGIFFSAILRDITQRQQADKALKKREELFRQIANNIHEIFGLASPDGRKIIYINPAYETIFGLSRQRLYENPGEWSQAVHPEDRARIGAAFSKLPVTGGFDEEYRIVRPDGSIRWLRSHSSPIRDQSGAIYLLAGITEDITRRKLAEQELERLRRHQELILNSAWEGILGLDLNGNITFVNRAAAKMLGYDAAELLGRQGHFIWHYLKSPEASYPVEECPICAAIKAGAAYCALSEEVFWRRDGHSFPVEYSLAPILEQGEVVGGVLTFCDISQRREAEALSRSLIETSPVGVYLLQDSRFTLTNHWFHTITGYSEADLATLDFWNLVHPDDRLAVRENAVKMLRGESFSPYEYRAMTKGGETRWIMETVTPIRYQGKRATLGYFMDVSERKQLEDKLLHAQKMEAVGRLAGGVAHDFNNMLTAIMGYVEMMQGHLRQGDPLYRQVRGIKKATDRAAALTRQLLAFSRKQILQPQVINFNAVIMDTEGMLRRLIGEDIELVTVLEPSLGNVKADPGQIEQVIMNLSVNARDAMPRGGKLTIETANIEFFEPHDCKFEIATPGHYAMLAVSDTGLGMDRETQDHLFEPFYTTKEVGKGTGLGLSTVYGIVKQSEGCIEVLSRPGAGTTFIIYLPRVAGAVAATVSAPPTGLQGSETILVVEDEDMVRQLIADALGLYGYQALAAANGGEALLLCERHQGPIQLMLTDVVMPNLSGRELAERLTPLHPEMQVLYMSGYTEDIIGDRGVLEEGALFIQKPFTPGVLVQKVRQVLDAASGK